MVLSIAVAGGVGAVLRYLLSKLNRDLPWGTLLANNIAVATIPIFTLLTGDLSQALIIGFAGALSTVSTFALEITQLNRDLKVKYTLLTLVTCLASYQLINFLL